MDINFNATHTLLTVPVQYEMKHQAPARFIAKRMRMAVRHAPNHLPLLAKFRLSPPLKDGIIHSGTPKRVKK